MMMERIVTTRIGDEKLTFPLPMDIAYDESRCQYVIHVPKTDRRVDDIAARYELSEVYEV